MAEETDIERWRWRGSAMLVVLAVALLRVAYLAWTCPLDLAPDEAHYWDWSRHLDWSYYSKGPLVAWLIRAGGTLTEPWLGHLPGGATLAVRRMSAIRVPRPGPSSTRRGFLGQPWSAQACTSHRPIISPNIWLISGAVVKSPAAPKGSRVA